jgi:alkyldihydroxyacetonephosphate synthase
MRRWNGWGDDQTSYPFPDSAARYLATLIGDGVIIPDASQEQILAAVPPSRLPPHNSIHTAPMDRLLHSRGQSLPDWVALRSGRIGVFPDGVAYPTGDQDVRSMIEFAQKYGVYLIPYGGGTSVVGHINPLPGDTPNLTIDLSRLSRLIELDETSRLATFEAGVCGPELERQLQEKGYTLGHFPQSFELSTLGGWIATRSCGQQSYYYGRIEDLFAGGHVETCVGSLDFPSLPASAAGPDLKQLLLGSEGRLGVITRATVRVRPMPEAEAFYGVFFHQWEAGVDAVRQIAQSKIPISMARLSDAQETDTTLALSGKDNLVKWAKLGLNSLRYGPERCLLIMGITGNQHTCKLALNQARSICRQHGGLLTGTMIGKTWRKSRFSTPYLRNVLWERGYVVDTLETAVPWREVLVTASAMKDSLREGLASAGISTWGKERALVFAHLSHVYRDGASIYLTYLYRRSVDPDETQERWLTLKSAASRVIVDHRGTISHQHGVGVDHAPYLEAEKGEVGMQLLKQAVQALDPNGILNPEKLYT